MCAGGNIDEGIGGNFLTSRLTNQVVKNSCAAYLFLVGGA